MSPLAGDQLALVLAHAKTVPRTWRSRLLDLIADQLTGRELDDTTVRQGIAAVDRMIGVDA